MPSALPATVEDHKPSKTPSISRKVREAIDHMVWLGLPRAEAAAKAGISDHGLYKALRSPPVKAAYLAECEVLRVSGRARRIHRLETMVEQDENKAAVVNAVRALELMGADEATAGGRSSLPGLQIVIVQHGNGPQPMTIEHGSVLPSEPSD